MLFPVNAWFMLLAGHLNVNTMATTSAPAGLHTRAEPHAHPSPRPGIIPWIVLIHQQHRRNSGAAGIIGTDVRVLWNVSGPTWEACL